MNNGELKQGQTLIVGSRYSRFGIRKIKVLEVTETSYYLKNMDTDMSFRTDRKQWDNDNEVKEVVSEQDIPDALISALENPES